MHRAFSYTETCRTASKKLYTCRTFESLDGRENTRSATQGKGKLFLNLMPFALLHLSGSVLATSYNSFMHLNYYYLPLSPFFGRYHHARRSLCTSLAPYFPIPVWVRPYSSHLFPLLHLCSLLNSVRVPSKQVSCFAVCPQVQLRSHPSPSIPHPFTPSSSLALHFSTHSAWRCLSFSRNASIHFLSHAQNPLA